MTSVTASATRAGRAGRCRRARTRTGSGSSAARWCSSAGITRRSASTTGRTRASLTLCATWAGSGGVEFFLGNSAQLAVFQLMHHAYNKARLTGKPELLNLALWLLQSDNLHLIQRFGRVGQEAEVSAYFTPREWWSLGPIGIITELQQVYKNFIRALDAWI